ncbi:MAG: hypothetical protein R2824_33970 [Saprospiraceae bacterium]|nr:hypothetical protein [Lewinella sp.]
MKTSDIHELLIYSFDNELTEEEQLRLQQALTASPDLQRVKESYLKMRSELADLTFEASPSVADAVMQQLSVSQKLQKNNQPMWPLKKIGIWLGLIILGLAGVLLIRKNMDQDPPEKGSSITIEQHDVSAILQKMDQTVDQFDDTFESKNWEDEISIIYIPGSNDPFGRVYDKHKGKKLVANTQFIGGFKEMMADWDPEQKKKHLQEAFRVRYGKDHFRILLDFESEIQARLKTAGYAIIRLSKKDRKIISRKDYGFDRIAFFKDLQPYFKN